jgi:hypothetical protein
MIGVDQASFQCLLTGIFCPINLPLYLRKQAFHLFCPRSSFLFISPGQLPEVMSIAKCVGTPLVRVVRFPMIMYRYPFVVRKNISILHCSPASFGVGIIISELFGGSGM